MIMFFGSWKWDLDVYRIVFMSLIVIFLFEKDIFLDLLMLSCWRCDCLIIVFGIKILESFCWNFIGIFVGNLVKYEIV